MATVAGGSTTSAAITGLGDEIPYTCGVRACAAGNVCDTNTATLTRTLPDGGAPLSQGISSVSLVNGQAVIAAPWRLSDGAVWKRRIYYCVGNAATCGTDLNNYTLATTNMAAQIYTPNTSITLSTVISQNTTYSFLLTDEDASGNVSSVQSAPVLLTTGDLTKPVFSGLSSLSVGTPSNQSDTTMSLNFTAITRELDNATTGASHYQIYYFQGSGDACATGTLRSEFSATSYTPGNAYTYLATGLTPRTIYSFCLKARDSAGNISNTTQYYTKQTQDVTAPAFDGIQGITYDTSTGNFTVAWNRSTATDRSTYKFSVSKNAGAYTTYTFTDSSNPNGISFTKTSLGTTFADLDLLRMYVNACDDASTIVGGADNCTTFTTPLTYTIPDVSPPSNFLGIDAGNTVNAGQGNVTVAWLAPSPVGTWTSEGYRGFIVYSVDSSNNLTQMKDCACVQTDCSDHLTSCTLTGLDARRTYKFHVRAYDAARNITTSLSPVTSVTSIQTLDTTAPSFSGNVAASIVSSAVQIAWSTATDNQYASEAGAALTYQIYRKTGSNFTTIGSPQTDADVGYPFTKSTSPYTETSVVAGTTYYYTVCVKDASNNRTCAPSSSSLTPPDLTPPTVASFASNKTASTKTWNLTWSMSDNVTATANLSVQLYVSFSATAGTATTADTLIPVTAGATTKTGLVGRQNTNEYVNYLLVVTDAAGNSTTATLSLYSANAVTITSITRSSGTITGGKFVFVVGTGFDSTATITVGNQACTNTVQYYTSTMMGCVTPSTSGAGAVNLVITNTDGSTATATYTYYNYTGAGSDHICDNPTQPTATFYSGSGVNNADPYLICTATQFMLIGPATTGSYFKLMDNLDVLSWNTNNFGVLSFTNKNLAGNNMVIANWTRGYTAGLPLDISGNPQLGLFSTPSGSISNFGLVNASITNTTSVGSTGILAGYTNGGLTATNVFAQGSVNAGTGSASNAGGLVGFVRGHDSYTGAHFHGSVSNSAIGTGTGGLIGYVQDYLTGGSTLSNCYSTGTVTTTGTASAGGLLGTMIGVTITSDQTLNNLYSTATVTSAAGAGGLIGTMTGGSAGRKVTLSSSYATGNVSGTTQVGGLVGTVSGFTAGMNVVIDSVYATGSVTATSLYSGGLLGYVYSSVCTTGTCGAISNSYATGSVTSSAGYAGGLIGYYRGNDTNTGATTLSNLYATGAVKNATATTASYMGGLIGYAISNYSITNSYATGNVNGALYLGGFIGNFGYLSTAATTYGATVQNSYATGNVTSNATGSTYAGGFIGFADTCNNASTPTPANIISQSYSTGSVVGVSDNGSFIGYVKSTVCSDGSLNKITITDSYSSGSISGSGTGNGGFIGNATAASTLTRVFATGPNYASGTSAGLVSAGVTPTVTNSFWDTQTTLQSTTLGSAGTGKTTAQMQTQATFTGFDFSTTPVWKISAGQYPKLGWQP